MHIFQLIGSKNVDTVLGSGRTATSNVNPYLSWLISKLDLATEVVNASWSNLKHLLSAGIAVTSGHVLCSAVGGSPKASSK